MNKSPLLKLNIATMYTFAIILVYLVVIRYYLSTINYNMFVFALVVLWGVTTLLCACRDKDNLFKTLLYLLVFVLMLELSYSVKTADISDDFTRVWHFFYSIKAVEKIYEHGKIEVLVNYFDNFGSSPGTPIMTTIAHIVSALPPLAIHYFYGLILFVLLIVSPLYLLSSRIIFSNIAYVSRPLILINFLKSLIIALPLIIFTPKTFNYFMSGIYFLALLIYGFLVFMLLNRESSISSRTYLLLTLLAVAESVYYLPIAWTSVILITLLWVGKLFVSIIDKNRNQNDLIVSTKRYTTPLLIILIAVTLYTLYWGYFFFEDLSFAIWTVLRSFQLPIVRISYTPARLVKYGIIETIVIYMNRIHTILIPVIAVVSMTMILRYIKNNLVKIMTVLATATLGATYLGYFVHELTDYIYRLNPIAMFLFVNQLTTFLTTLKRSRLFKKLLNVIILVVFIASLGSYINVLIIYTQPRYSFDIDYYAYEAYTTSLFVARHIDYSKYRTRYLSVFGDYRYGFSEPLSGIVVKGYSNHTISNIVEDRCSNESMLIIPIYNTDVPNRDGYILNIELFKSLQKRFPIVYNSMISYIIYKEN